MERKKRTMFVTLVDADVDRFDELEKELQRIIGTTVNNVAVIRFAIIQAHKALNEKSHV